MADTPASRTAASETVLVAVVVPQVGEAIAEATLVEWLAAPGDVVEQGEPLFEVDTEKSVVEIEAFVGGRVEELLVAVDAPVVPGQRIATLRVAREDVPRDAEVVEPRGTGASDGTEPGGVPDPDAGRSAPTTDPATTDPATSDPATTDPAARAPGSGRRVSPRARRAASELAVDLTAVTGSGPSGAISEDDVRAHADQAPTDDRAAAGREPLGRLRRAVADATTRSKQEVPHFYVDLPVDARPVEAAREASSERPSVTAFLVLACDRALRELRGLAASYDDGALRRHEQLRVGLAVATDDGLQVPVLGDLSSADPAAAHEQVAAAVERARSGRLSGDDLGPRSLVVSNLGMFGAERFHAVINEPDPFIVSAGAIRDVAVVDDGTVVAGRELVLALSADHRAVDGADAARFLACVASHLRDPDGLAAPDDTSPDATSPDDTSPDDGAST